MEIGLKNYLKKCPACGRYSLEEKCSCGDETEHAHPAKYSIEDKYAVYRRKAKYPELFQ